MLAPMKAVLSMVTSALADVTRYGLPDDRPDGLWWVRWQNLSKDDKKGELPVHGRAWLNFAPHGATGFRLEWNLWSRFAHVGLDVDRGDGAVRVFAALPPVAFWFTFESWPLLCRFVSRTGDRTVRLSVHDSSIWWKLWVDPGRWSESTPRWRDGSACPADFLFGKPTYVEVQVEEPVPVAIPMPEGAYEGVCTMKLVSRGRPRLPRNFSKQAVVELKTPIPVPGKGENSWDCDDDALYSSSGPARSVGDAIAQVVHSVLTTRERRGGLNWTPAPPAQAAAQA